MSPVIICGVANLHLKYLIRDLTSSVLGGKNSKEKKVFPALMDSFILSTIFMIASYQLTAVQSNWRAQVHSTVKLCGTPAPSVDTDRSIYM